VRANIEYAVLWREYEAGKCDAVRIRRPHEADSGCFAHTGRRLDCHTVIQALFAAKQAHK
jgi:hypothetical protein